eukprot:10352068-Ditylum_brightwellii.AAC.1
MDCFRLLRLNGTILNNDAAACNDRMIPEVSSIHLQSLGLPKEAAKCSVKHHIKTTAGVSAANYKHEPGSEKY